MERILEFKVLNVKQIRHDSVIGSFMMDLGVVYSQHDHCYAFKWLFLADAKHGDGHVKVNALIRGGIYGQYHGNLKCVCEATNVHYNYVGHYSNSFQGV